jgi:L,D-peptidoglycan transpeptidase YkuD (ErfK/YbiS/YcfS/YnhG family)
MKIKLWFFVTLAIMVLAGILIQRFRNYKTPEMEVMRASKMLAEAQLVKSLKFAKHAFQEASDNYNAAMSEWDKQNDRFILLRDYTKVSQLAKKSSHNSEIAIASSKKFINNTEDLLQVRINKIGGKIQRFADSFGNFPMDKKHREEYNKSKLLYAESLIAFKNKNYLSCKLKLDSVEIVVNDYFIFYQKKVNNYFEAYPQWNHMVNQTIVWSKKNKSYALVVDKYARQLSIYKDGTRLQTLAIEIGANWIGDKRQQGDQSTPEGLYKIVQKKQNGQTKYHKALLLDYPNEHDKQRFSLNKMNGLLKQDANIGNLIEIHGNGGKGSDWTDGCIALKNSDMDELFKICTLGTKVTIVGSTKLINDLPNNIR